MTVFVIDSRVNERYISGPLQRLSQGASHGDLVTWIIRNEAPNVEVKGISINTKSGTTDYEKYINGLKHIKRYKENYPDQRVLVNISLSFTNDKAQVDIIKKLNRMGIKIIAAAGNDNSETPVFPAAMSEVIAVANANKKGKAESSNYGQYIDIAAPGDIKYIERAYFPGQTITREMKHIGTSFSAPRVTGIAANILEQKPSLTGDQVIDLIKETASSIASPLYYEGYLGAGLVNKKGVMNKINSSFSFWKKLQVMAVGLLLSGMILIFWRKKGFVGIFLFVLLSLMIIPVILGIAPILLVKIDKNYLLIGLLLLVSIHIVLKMGKWILIKVINYFNLGLPLLYVMLSLPDQDIRKGIKDSLMIYPDQKLKSFFLNKLKNLINPAKKEIAIEILALLEEPPLKEIMDSLLVDKKLIERTGKILSRHNRGQEKIINTLVGYLHSGERDYQKLSANLLIYFDTLKVIPIFKEILEDYLESMTTNNICIYVLEALGKRPIVDSRLSRLLYQIIEEDSQMWIRYQALRVLANVNPHDQKFYNLLRELLNDSQPLVRMEARYFYFDFS